MKFRYLIAEKTLNKFGYFCFVWLTISCVVSVFWSDNIACLYSDLPFYLRGLPKYLLSLAYLIFVVPPLVLSVGFGIVTIIFIIRNGK